MIKAHINKESKQQTIEATGSIPELMNDLAVLISGIHSQFNAVSPAAAKLFRTGITRMINDPNGQIWKPAANQTGIAIQMPDKEDEE